MVSGPPCATCGTSLRWFPEQYGWGCDRCRTFMPSAPPQAQAAPVVRAPGRARTGLYIGIGVGVVAVAGVVIGLVLRSGGAGGAGSKEELATQTVAAMAAGDVDKLVALADLDTLYDLMDCKANGGDRYGGAADKAATRRRQRDDLTRAVAHTRKVAIEVLRVEDADDRLMKFEKGDRTPDGCVPNVDITSHALKIAVRYTPAGGKPREGTVKVYALEAEGGWFLVEAPDFEELEAAGGMDDAIAKFREFRDRMCACRDRTCADAVSNDMTSWSTAAATSLTSARPSDEQTKEMGALSEAMGTCMMKAMDPGSANAGPFGTPTVDAAPAVPAVPATGRLPAACDDYLDQMRKLQNCPGLPASSRDAYAKALVQVEQSWGDLTNLPASALTAMADACKQGADALRQSMSSLCP